MFWWMSTHRQRTGIEICWSYFCTAHGKCWCDPEGGTLKNRARARELEHVEGIKYTRMPTTTDLCEWAVDALKWPAKHLFHNDKKGRGIYRRWIIQLPTQGSSAVDYRAKLECFPMDETRAVHQITGNGGDGKLLTRDRSCHQCDACWELKWADCENTEFVGQVWPVTLPKPKQVA